MEGTLFIYIYINQLILRETFYMYNCIISRHTHCLHGTKDRMNARCPSEQYKQSKRPNNGFLLEGPSPAHLIPSNPAQHQGHKRWKVGYVRCYERWYTNGDVTNPHHQPLDDKPISIFIVIADCAKPRYGKQRHPKQRVDHLDFCSRHTQHTFGRPHFSGILLLLL